MRAHTLCLFVCESQWCAISPGESALERLFATKWAKSLPGDGKTEYSRIFVCKRQRASLSLTSLSWFYSSTEWDSDYLPLMMDKHSVCIGNRFMLRILRIGNKTCIYLSSQMMMIHCYLESTLCVYREQVYAFILRRIFRIGNETLFARQGRWRESLLPGINIVCIIGNRFSLIRSPSFCKDSSDGANVYLSSQMVIGIATWNQHCVCNR